MHPVLVLCCALEAGTGPYADRALLEGALQLFGDRLVLGGDQSRQGLDDRDLRAEGSEDGCELHTDHTAAEDHDPLRDVVELQGLIASHEPAADLQARQRLGERAAREHDIAPAQRAFPTLTSAGLVNRPEPSTYVMRSADFTRPCKPL